MSTIFNLTGNDFLTFARWVLEQKGLTLKNVGDIFGVSPQAVSKWLKLPLNKAKKDKLIKGIGLTDDWLEKYKEVNKTFDTRGGGENLNMLINIEQILLNFPELVHLLIGATNNDRGRVLLELDNLKIELTGERWGNTAG